MFPDSRHPNPDSGWFELQRLGLDVPRQLLDQLLKHSPAVLEILELIVARASRREQNDVAGRSSRKRLFDGNFERPSGDNLRGARKVPRNFLGRLADHQHLVNTFRKERPQRGVRGAFVFAPHDQVHAALEGGKRLGRRRISFIGFRSTYTDRFGTWSRH